MENKVILISGYSRLPTGTVSSEVYGVMALVLLIDFSEGTIQDVDCTLSTRLAERFVASLIIGRSLKNGPQELISLIEDVYQGSAQKAIIAALRDINIKYLKLKLNRGVT